MTHRSLALVLLLALSGTLPAAEPASRTHQVRLNGHVFTLPVGFTIELAAGPPLVDRPITAAFDEQGHLYVADSSGSRQPVVEQLRRRPHRIVRLESSKGDGRFDRAQVFADRMMFPEGTMWYAGSLYVAAPPSIWKLTDTKGTGTADQRSEWFQGKTLTGCANDLHGPYPGPDGWIYWCKGAFARQTYPRPGKKPFSTRAAHIFRCRPDGSGLEPVMTGGMDNPVDVVFTPGGERIFTTTFLQHPGGGRRDGLIHAVYGGIYGKDHDPIHEHPWTGPTLMPVLSHLGPAAPCGLARYESSVFGPDYQDNLFATLFNMQKVTRHILEPSGATFRSRDLDFLVSSNRDFHPTDVLEDADGSLLVLDTGGWYKLCCPTSQLGKPDVLGAIYRIRRTGAERVVDPRGLKMGWKKASAAELAKRLDDPRPAVRQRNIETLAGRGAKAVAALEDVLRGSTSAQARRNAVWTLTRIDSAAARAVVRRTLADADDSVRQVAAHSISLHRDRAAVPELLRLLKQSSAHNRRVAAEALGRIGDASAVPALLALADTTDRVLEHSAIFALIEIADRTRTLVGLKSPRLRIQRAALIALDQMEGGNLSAPVVARYLNASDPVLKEAASWIVGRHPEWGTTLAGFYRERLTAQPLRPGDVEELSRQLARLARTPAIQELLLERLLRQPRAAQQVALRVLAQAGLKETPTPWLEALPEILNSSDRELAREALSALRTLRLPKTLPPKLVSSLHRIASESDLPSTTRLAALAVVAGSLKEVSAPLFSLIRSSLDRERPVAERTLAAEVLAHARLRSDQLLALAGTLKKVGPMELGRVVEAFAQSKDDAVGKALVVSLKTAPARTSLRPERLRPVLAKYGPKLRAEAEGLYRALDTDAPQQKARLEKLLATLKPGDIRRGQLIFNSAKASCVACHAVGYLGGKVGPDLTRVGRIRGKRDLLESIIFPSASLAQGYEPVTVTTTRGKVYNGLVRGNTPEGIVLVVGADQQVRLARKEIEEMQPSKVSVMPAGLDQQLNPQELADLVAFLEACK